MRLALTQCNPMVGDVDANAAAILSAYSDGVHAGAALVATPELALTGYPPEDLVLKPAFLVACGDALARIAAAVGEVPLVVGFVESAVGRQRSWDTDGRHSPAVWHRPAADATAYPPLANAAAVCRHGQVEAVYRKQRLPNYGVFDEDRYFSPGVDPVVVAAGGGRVGVTICEDLWGERGPVGQACAEGADVVLNLNASPYHRGKRAERERWARHHATACRTWIPYLNCVGGQDEVVFDGDSFVMDPNGRVTARAAQFTEQLFCVDAGTGKADEAAGETGTAPLPQPDGRLDPVGEVYAALVLGTRDYLRKNGFMRALLGLSGGIDSALVAALAADAIGPDAVTGVAMPSPYSSSASLIDAKALAANLGIGWLELGIEPVMRAFDEVLREPFAGTDPGVAEENLQSRIRGTLLMALSNKSGDLSSCSEAVGHKAIVLATGNKSEYAVGYSTLYGDMAGGFAVIKDVSKTLVYQLCHHRNTAAGGRLIPPAILDKAPSAELRPDQRDTDSLPPYDELDLILEAYVEQDRSVRQIVADGHDAATVRRVIALVDRAEYKRRQAAPGVKITPRAFGKDRRLPITQAWSG